MAGNREIYLQFKAIGDQIQVVAIDSVTAIEVSIFGPRNTPRQELERIAVNKLQRRLQKLPAEKGKGDGIII